MFFFSESGHDAHLIKVKEVYTNIQGNTDFTYALDLWRWVEMSDIEIVQM